MATRTTVVGITHDVYTGPIAIGQTGIAAIGTLGAITDLVDWACVQTVTAMVWVAKQMSWLSLATSPAGYRVVATAATVIGIGLGVHTTAQTTIESRVAGFSTNPTVARVGC